MVKTTLSRWVSALLKSTYADLVSKPLTRALAHSASRVTKGGGTFGLPYSQTRTHEVRNWSITLAAANSFRLDKNLANLILKIGKTFRRFYLRNVSSLHLNDLHSLSAFVDTGHSCRIGR